MNGGGLSLEETSVALENVVLERNQASSGVGGGMFIDHLFSALNQARLAIQGCRFKSNQALGGGGLYSREPVGLTNVHFVENYARSLGGGVYAELAGDASTVTFTDNTSNHDEVGSGHYVASDGADGDGIDDGIDNCPGDSNPSQRDRDNNNTGDACAGFCWECMPSCGGWRSVL